MTPERWRQIEELYHAARERGPGVWADADPELRREVESLLAEDGSRAEMIDQPADSMTTPGSQIGPYRIETSIGKGGMGEVWKARDSRLNRDVAIKFSAQQFSDRFTREARAIAALNHPNICTLYDIGPNYLAMEYIEGTPLHGPLPLEQTLKYAEQICDALDAAHCAGIVHRDLKPGNILVASHGIKLLDFGLAQIQSSPGDSTITQLTHAGAVMGTPSYMAPEQWEGKQADARSDIYAFGCILYEMLTGKRAAGRLAAPLSNEVSPELGRVISKCLENDPDLRYQHASEIRADLRRLERLPGDTARRRVVATVAAALLLLAAGYFLFPLVLHGKPKLTDKDTIVLADFTNTTGDPVFDETLRRGLSVQLEQSPLLSLVSDQAVQKTLGLMGQPADARLTPKIATEICERNGSAVVLDGSIASLGSQYVLGLRARACRSGDVLDEEQVQAARKEDVLNALSQIATKFRSRVGESLAMVQKHDAPLAEATTPSLEALKAYSVAMKVLHSTGDATALPLFKRAVAIDPEFAIAHAYLGRTYGDIGEAGLSAESTRRAWQLRDRTTDAEKFFIMASYDLNATGNMEAARQTFESWEQTYPRAYDAPGLLSGMVYPILGQYEKAIEQAKKAIALNPDVPFAYVNLATALQFLGRLDEAEAALRQMSGRKLEIPEMLVQQYDLAFLRDDKPEMESAVGGCQGKCESISAHEAFVLAYYGHLKQAEALSRRGVDLARQANHRELAAMFESASALLDAFFGNVPGARRGASEALGLSKGRDAEYGAALALALVGDSVRAQALANDLGKRFPEDTSVQFSYLPVLRALIALQPPLNQKGDPAKAIEALQVSVPYELGVPESWFSGIYGVLYPVYVRGEAYLAAHQGAEAAAEFRKIIDHRAIVATDPIGALAHLQLGRALALSGDKTGARSAYEDFLKVWKDADPDIPIFGQAKSEYARLR